MTFYVFLKMLVSVIISLQHPEECCYKSLENISSSKPYNILSLQLVTFSAVTNFGCVVGASCIF